MTRRRVVGAVVIAATMAGVEAAGASTPLVDAVKAADRNLVRVLLRQHVDVNATDPDGATALHWAVRADDGETTEALLRAGANATAVTRYGITPLALAATNGSARLVGLLLEAGSDPNTATPAGETALMTAARTGDVETVRLLLDHGADVNARDHSNGETALMWAAAEGHADAARLLVERGSNRNARSSVLEYPDAKIDIALVWRVEMPRGGLTPLMFAARQGALASVRTLTDMGADVDAADPDGTTALVMAIINAHYDVASLLLERGANPEIADAAGMTALYAAVDMHHKEPMFNRPVPKPSGTLGALDLIQQLLDRGADPNARLKTPLLARQHDAGDPLLGEGATPFMRAAKASDLDLMNRLMASGADPALTLKNGTTALMIAAAQEAEDVTDEQTLQTLRLCLARGIDVNAASESGATALHMAVGKADEVIRFLVANGARLDAKDSAGRTPLDLALGVPGKDRQGRPARPGPIHEASAALLKELSDTAAAVGTSR